MRCKRKTKASQVGKRRIITKFAILPITVYHELTNDVETRWLETVTVRQEYTAGATGMCEPPSYYWRDIEFVEEGQKE